MQLLLTEAPAEEDHCEESSVLGIAQHWLFCKPKQES